MQDRAVNGARLLGRINLNVGVRNQKSSRLWRERDRLIYRVRGSGFLKHMVRNMIGTLLEAGKGNVDELSLRALLKPEGRGGPTAPAKGLTLVSVSY